MSDKEQCFKDAIKKYQDTTKTDLGLQFEKQWVKDLTNGWAQRADEGAIQQLFNSIKKTADILLGNRAPRDPGAANPTQLRRPDITVNTKDGKPLVLDNKFTGKDGKPDPWRTQPGQSGSDQRGDYNDINKQNGGKGQDLSLNKDVCKCNGEPQPVEVLDPEYATAPAPDFVPFMPLPGLGGIQPLPSLPPITLPEFPIFEPAFAY